MKNIQKIIVLFLLLLVLFQVSSNSVFSKENYINSSEVPNSSRIISLRINKKPISQVLRKLATKGKFNIIVAPGFIDNVISLNLKKVSIKEALDSLSSLSEFGLLCEKGNIIAKTIEKPEINTVVVSLEHTQAIQIAYSVNKSINLPEDCSIGYDEISNSIILQGDNNFLDKANQAIRKLDLPKKTSTFKLDNYTASQAADYMNKKIFKSTVDNEIKEEVSGDIKLEPVIGDDAEFVIKGIIEKSNFNALTADKPIIITEAENNEVTIIGNSYQIEVAKAFLSYVDGKKIDKDEEIRRAHREIYETKNSLKLALAELEESRKLLAQSIKDQEFNPNELLEAKEEAARLSLNLNNSRSEIIWNSLITSNINNEQEYNEKISGLTENISSLESKLSEKEKLISEFEANKKQWAEQLKAKDDQLQTAYNQLSELKSKLDSSIVYNSGIEVQNNTDENSSSLAITKKELMTAKNELVKAQQQLEASKQQLELIFGGKILKDTVVPNNKSTWFKAF